VNWDLLWVDRLWEMIDDACILCYEHSHRRYLNCICIKTILDFLIACFVAPVLTVDLSGVDASVFLLPRAE